MVWRQKHVPKADPFFEICGKQYDVVIILIIYSFFFLNYNHKRMIQYLWIEKALCKSSFAAPLDSAAGGLYLCMYVGCVHGRTK